MARPLDDRNVVVSSCPAGQLVGAQAKKAEGRSSVRMIRCLAPALSSLKGGITFGLRFGDGVGRLGRRPRGRPLAAKPVVVLGEPGQGRLQALCGDRRTSEATRSDRSPSE